MPGKKTPAYGGAPPTLGTTSRAYSVSRTRPAPGAYEAMKMQERQNSATSQDDYAKRALAYMAAVERNKVNNAANATPGVGTQASSVGPSPFSQTGINVVPPQEAIQPAPTPAAPPPPNPIEEGYQRLKTDIEGTRSRTAADIAAAKMAIGKAYSDAIAGNDQTIGLSQQAVADQSKALGVDFASSTQGQLINQAIRQRQEMSDQLQANNLSALEKQGTLQGSLYDILAAQALESRNAATSQRDLLAQEKQAALNEIAAQISAALSEGGSGGGGGGGGGRRRGGGGRSGSSGTSTLTDQAQETSYINDVGDLDIVTALMRESPMAAAYYDRAKTLGGGDTQKGLTEIQKLIDANAAPYKKTNLGGLFSGIASFSNKIKANQQKSRNTNLNKAKRALYATSGFYGNPTTTQKSQSNSTTKNKRP